uniref:Uncharacterized protein n=1 Tax=Glossina pallidipes TaxID=7398 RepID=A0A1B0A7B5_GLOPL
MLNGGVRNEKGIINHCHRSVRGYTHVYEGLKDTNSMGRVLYSLRVDQVPTVFVLNTSIINNRTNQQNKLKELHYHSLLDIVGHLIRGDRLVKLLYPAKEFVHIRNQAESQSRLSRQSQQPQRNINTRSYKHTETVATNRGTVDPFAWFLTLKYCGILAKT